MRNVWVRSLIMARALGWNAKRGDLGVVVEEQSIRFVRWWGGFWRHVAKRAAAVYVLLSFVELSE